VKIKQEGRLRPAGSKPIL